MSFLTSEIESSVPRLRASAGLYRRIASCRRIRLAKRGRQKNWGQKNRSAPVSCPLQVQARANVWFSFFCR